MLEIHGIPGTGVSSSRYVGDWLGEPVLLCVVCFVYTIIVIALVLFYLLCCT